MPDRRPTWDAHGITSYREGAAHLLPWAEIVAVFGYKKDCYAVDDMRLLVLGRTDTVECSESDQNVDGQGFEDLCFRLDSHLGLTRRLYLELLARPAFDETRVQFYPETRLPPHS